MGQKMDRINSEIQKVLAGILNNDINDPRVHGIISVVKVDTTQDQSFSTVWVSIYADDKQEVFDAIKKAGGYIRKLLASKVLMRNTPKLIFVLDNGIEYSEKINKILSTIDIPEEEEDGTEDN